MDKTHTTDEIYIMAMPEETPTEHDPMLGLSDIIGKLQSTKVKLTDLSENIKLFMGQMETLFSEVPTALGEFEFSEFEVSAGINADGKLTLFGVAGAEAGIQGGLKFVFKKRDSDN